MNPELATALKERMGDETQGQFAKRLGISPSYVSFLLNGLVPGIGSKGAQAILRHYPELVSLFLSDDIVQAIRASTGETLPRE